MPYGVVLKDERPTSNIERPTSNEKQTSNHAKAWFLFIRFDTRNENLSQLPPLKGSKYVNKMNSNDKGQSSNFK